MRKRLVIFAASLLFLISFIVPAQYVAAAEPDRYGYTLLTGEGTRAAYRAIAEGIGNLSDSIDLSDLDITEAEVDIAADMVCADYPEYFWYSGAYFISVSSSASGDKINALIPAFKPNDASELEQGYGIGGTRIDKNSTEFVTAKNAFQAAVNTALTQIPSGASDYKKTEILHDYLAGIVTYVSNPNDQNAYGALVQGNAVCAGYARAYQYLLYRAGIRSWYVSGQSYSPEGQPVEHAWNLVWLDGCCYYSDVTWDDQGESLFHYYLNLSLEQMQVSHFSKNPLPSSCGHTHYSYFTMNAAPGKGICNMTGNESGVDIARYFELRSVTADQAEYRCAVKFHGPDFGQWIGQQIQNLIQGLALTGDVRYEITSLGQEYQITITGTKLDSVMPSDTPTTENGGGDGALPPEQTQPPQQSVDPTEIQPTEQTQPSAITTPQETTPAVESEPTVMQGTDGLLTVPTNAATRPTEMNAPANEPAAIVIPVIAGVILLGAAATAFVLVKRKH